MGQATTPKEHQRKEVEEMNPLDNERVAEAEEGPYTQSPGEMAALLACMDPLERDYEQARERLWQPPYNFS